MVRHKSWFWLSLLSFGIALAPALVRAQETAPAVMMNASEMKFVEFPGLPTCFHGSVPWGDPGTGPSIILAKGAAGCVIPWHWHTPNERVMVVSGTGRFEMKGGKAIAFKAGAFAMMPSKHVHQASCATACTLYIYSDAAFDIYYVDAKGQEISPADALKAVKETAAVAAKK